MRRQFESRLEENKQIRENITTFSISHLNDPGDLNKFRQETIYKIIIIVFLSLACVSCACMLTIFPLFYFSMGISINQFNSMLTFCEETSQMAADESFRIFEEFKKR